VARNGGSLAAAKALKTSQSTVHRRLKELERRLGHSLIKRHPTGYRLRELGNAMLVHAERIEEAVTSFARNLAASDQNPTGTVRVTLSRDVWLPPDAIRPPRQIGRTISGLERRICDE
jgi:DNA-binding transcriptional LysR family regulator